MVLIGIACDLVNPALVLAALINVAIARQRSRLITILPLALTCALGMSVVCGLLFIERVTALQGSLGFDYSTHTAFAMVMCAGLSTSGYSKRLLSLVLVEYLLLMVLQGYHSVLDLVVTGGVFTLILLGVGVFVQRVSVKLAS